MLNWTRRTWTRARWTQAAAGAASADVSALAEALARHIVHHRLRGTPQFQVAWERVVGGGAPYNATELAAMTAFFKVIRPEIPIDHAEAFIGEYLWHMAITVDEAEPELIQVLGPKFHVTAPGGDGLVIRRGAQLRFTVWEIKKRRSSDLSSAVREAYDQLTRQATEYLAEYSATEQVIADAATARFFGRLVEAWVNGEPDARAGVAVTSSHAPARCFSTMGNYFTQLVVDDSRHGMTLVVPDYPAFAQRVRELLWTGL